MTLRTGHGNGAGVPRIEVLPVDELPAGVPGHARPESPGDRDERGLFARGNKLSVEGGRSKAGQTRLAHRLRLGDSFADPRFEPYARSAVAFRRAQITTIAASVGGGTCGPAPSSMVASAALQLAGSRFAFEILGDMQLGSRLANDSRQNLLAAHEIAAKEATARQATSPAAVPWLIAAPQPPPKRVSPRQAPAVPPLIETPSEAAPGPATSTGDATGEEPTR